MFYYVNGELVLREPTMCVIDCGGVGYALNVSLLTSESLAAKIGSSVKLYTYLSAREDGVEMFGFGTNEERTAFNLLITVSGVGPKAAMNILSVLTPDSLAMAICTDNVKAISKAQNVGAKTAARIVLELKDKIAKDMPEGGWSGSGTNADTVSSVATVRGNISEAAEALLALGYDKNTVLGAVKSIDPTLASGEIIRLALKRLSR